MVIVFRSLAISIVMHATLLADEWPEFRGPAGDGLSQAENVPIKWNATEHVAWKTQIPGDGWSSPVLSYGRLYLTTAVSQKDSDDVSLRVVCLSATDGQNIWDVEVLRPDPDIAKQVHTKNSMASATPVIGDGRVYAHFGHMGTVALELDGNIVWRQTGVTYKPLHGNGGSPVLINGSIVFNCDAVQEPFVAALDQSTGELRWRTPRDSSARKKFSFSTPLVVTIDGEDQIVSAGSGLVGGYAPANGREIWRVRYGDGYSVVPRPVFAHGLLFLATGYDRAKLLAIDPKNALGDVTDTHVVWSHDRGAPLTPSPIVVGDELYFVSDNGVASCLDAHTKEVHWSERLGGDFSASPVSAEDRIYFQNESGATYVVAADKSFELLASNDIEERTLASPALADNAIFLRSESHLWRIE